MKVKTFTAIDTLFYRPGETPTKTALFTNDPKDSRYRNFKLPSPEGHRYTFSSVSVRTNFVFDVSAYQADPADPDTVTSSNTLGYDISRNYLSRWLNYSYLSVSENREYYPDLYLDLCYPFDFSQVGRHVDAIRKPQPYVKVPDKYVVNPNSDIKFELNPLGMTPLASADWGLPFDNVFTGLADERIFFLQFRFMGIVEYP